MCTLLRWKHIHAVCDFLLVCYAITFQDIPCSLFLLRPVAWALSVLQEMAAYKSGGKKVAKAPPKAAAKPVEDDDEDDDEEDDEEDEESD